MLRSYSLDSEEQAILEPVELDEWQSVADVTHEVQRYQRYAQSQVNTLETVSVELPADDLRSLQTLAQRSSISVSDLTATVVHRYVINQSSSQS